MASRLTLVALLARCQAFQPAPLLLQAARSRPVLVSTVRMATRNPNNLPTKTCVVCGRPFTWRKKWERCWDEVTTCSKRCNAERKKENRKNLAGEESDGSDSSDGRTQEEAGGGGRAARKEAKKAAKASRRAIREGTAASTVGQKPCDLCSRSVDLLVRCQLDSSKTWHLVCGSCWNTDRVAGGVVDGSGANPHYRYGGLWKNLKKPVPVPARVHKPGSAPGARQPHGGGEGRMSEARVSRDLREGLEEEEAGGEDLVQQLRAMDMAAAIAA